MDARPDRAFFEGIAHHRLAPAYVLAATTGMRRGEVLGVRWADIGLCFSGDSLFVRQFCRPVPDRARHQRRRGVADQSRSMTKRSESWLRIDWSSPRRRSASGAGYSDLDLVFARENVGQPIHPDYFSQPSIAPSGRLKAAEDPAARPPTYPCDPRSRGRHSREDHVRSARPLDRPRSPKTSTCTRSLSSEEGRCGSNRRPRVRNGHRREAA